MRHCRVVITDECNLKCDFCCMLQPEITESFVDCTAWWIAQQMYDELLITGGEPLLEIPRIIMLTSIARYFNPDIKTYVYTNGELLTIYRARLLKDCGVTGISMSIHSDFWKDASQHAIALIHETVLPIRILVGEHEVTEELMHFITNNDMDVRVWVMDDCLDMPKEDRYRLKDPDIRWR